MKHFHLTTSKALRSLLLACLLTAGGTAWADELTVSNGTNTNTYVPFYGNWADAYQKCEFIIPAEELATLKGTSISALKFYSTTASVIWNGSFLVFLKEVEATTMTAFTGTTDATVVFEGTGLSIDANKEMAVTFSQSYTYQGGNLLVGFYQTKAGNYQNMSFYGVGQASNTAWQGYNSSSLDAVNGSAKSFIPKTTFTYEAIITGPGLKVLEGSSKISSGYSYNFGLTTAGATKEFTLSNPGTESITLGIAATGGFGVSPANTTIAAGGEATLTVTMPDATSTGTVTITPTATDVQPFTINVSGTIRDASKLYENGFTALPTGWSAEGTWSYSEANGAYSQAYYLSSKARLKTPLLTLAEGETFIVEAKGYSTSNTSYQHLQMQYSADGESWTNFDAEPTLDPEAWGTFTFTGAPAGKYYIAVNASQASVRMFYGGTVVTEPKLVFTEADYSFGMVNADATSTAFTIQNTGLGELTGLTVTSDNPAFTVNCDATTIAATGQATFTVTLTTQAKGMQTATVTVSGDGVESQPFNVSGYVADETKIFETFAALPDRWTAEGTWYYDATKGAYSTAYGGGATLTSPKIKVAEGDKLAISAKTGFSGASYYLKLEGSADNGATWTAYSQQLSTASTPALSTTGYTVVEFTDIPATVNRLRLTSYYGYINGLNGFTYDDNDPKLGIFSNEACTAAVSDAAVSNDWGFISQDMSATYYIKNVGTGTMTVTATEAPAGFSAVLGQSTLAAGESTTFTIAMANDSENNEGLHSGTVTLTATDSEDNELGTFAVTASGVVVGSKTDVNFATLTAFPAGWEAKNWSVSSGKATISYNSGDLITGTYTVTEGEQMIIEARRNSSSSYATIALTYSYSTDGGATWSEANDITPATTSYQLTAISGIPAGNVMLKFTGTYVDISRIYGFTAVAKANMVLTPADESYDFGMQTADAEYVITVSNNGTAPMTGLTATLESGANYTATVSATTIAVGESATVTVTQLYDAANGFATLSDVLTIGADDLAAKTVALSGQTRDASKYFADFQGGLPEGWTADGWSDNYSGTNHFHQADYSGNNTLTTPALTVQAGKVLAYDLWGSYGSTTVTVGYSLNGGISWTEQQVSVTNAQTTYRLNMPTAGNVIVRFVGNSYARLDNFYGGELATEAPVLAVSHEGTAVADGYSYDFGTIRAAATTTFTVANTGTGTLTLAVNAPNGFTATLGKDALAANESTTLTLTMPVEEPYGQKEGTVTLQTSLGDFAIHYTATVMNPNAFFEDFAAGVKPDGWSFSGYWEVDAQQAQNTASGTYDLVTPLLSVAGEADAITFQAARSSSYSEGTLSVAYSEDGNSWTDAGITVTLTTSYQDVTVSGLPAGRYYLRLSGSRVKVDNFLGWQRVPGIVLDETTALPDLSDITESDVILRHSFVSGWNTLCLPFTVSVSDIAEGAEAYAFTGYDADARELQFQAVTTLQAAQPYVVYVPQAVTAPLVFSAVTIAATEAAAATFEPVAFQGTFAPVTFADLGDGPFYGLTAAGKIAKGSASVTIDGMRAYFTGVPAGARVAIAGGHASGISAISIDSQAPVGTYNMQGQRVQQFSRTGLYIVNGKKVVVK